MIATIRIVIIEKPALAFLLMSYFLNLSLKQETKKDGISIQ